MPVPQEQDRRPTIKLSKRALKIMQSAAAIALETSERIRTEHILFGLLEDSGIQDSFRAIWVDPLKIKQEIGKKLLVEEPLDTITHNDKSREIGLSPRSKSVVELAIDEAKTDFRQEVTPFHLLIGIIKNGEGEAAEVLKRFELNENSLSLFRNVCKNLERLPKQSQKGLLRKALMGFIIKNVKKDQ